MKQRVHCYAVTNFECPAKFIVAGLRDICGKIPEKIPSRQYQLIACKQTDLRKVYFYFPYFLYFLTH